MKNLFSVNKTHNREANDFEENRYLAARVSDEVQEKLRNAFSVMTGAQAPQAQAPQAQAPQEQASQGATPQEPTEEEKALKEKGNLYWVGCLTCFVAGFLLFFFGDAIPLYRTMPYLHLIDAALLVAAVVLHFMSRRITRRQIGMDNAKVELNFAEATKCLEEAAAEAARELGVPENALSVDILPFHYKLKSDYKTKDDIPVPAGKKNHFDNLSVSMFAEGDSLCLATAHELYRIPLSDIRGYREYDEDFELDMWLKPEEFNSPKYAEFGIRKSGIFSCKAHGYFGLDLGGDMEVWIPCYDFPQVKEFLHISKIS